MKKRRFFFILHPSSFLLSREVQQMKLRPLPLIVTACLLVVVGVVHGLRSDRWGVGQAVEEAARRLETVPQKVGAWSGKSFEIDENQLRIGQIEGYLSRAYRNPAGQEATVLMVCGRPGPIAVHTPDVCYRGAGFVVQGEPVKVEGPQVGGRKTSWWTAVFAKGGPVPQRLRIFWAWSPDGTRWEAADWPRFRFARHPALYKLYVVSPLVDSKVPAEKDPAFELLQELLPQLEKDLSPDS
jgi:hypothetical protein